MGAVFTPFLSAPQSLMESIDLAFTRLYLELCLHFIDSNLKYVLTQIGGVISCTVLGIWKC